jgi:glycosyltransferase involved in cell wall biosynthesis
MKPPLFSVVIPTFNRSDIFPAAVRSILAQTCGDFEVIVSDNYSTDDTPQVTAQFTDPRVKYVRTPRHVVIADSWEFARQQASGRLIIMLSDDDALISTTLESFAKEASRHDADFVFSGVARYRDRSFPGPAQNTIECPAFSGTSRLVSTEEFVRPLFLFRPSFDMHPSAFAFSNAIADLIHSRTGRYFWTNGVEFSAWPMTAVFAKTIVFVDAPLTILGRTKKSWGSNMGLVNPGKAQIQALIDDIDHERKHAPLRNFTTSNLMAEGMLTAKSLFPREFGDYEFDEVAYLRSTIAELVNRRSLGVDVRDAIDDALRYAAKYPSLRDDLERRVQASPTATSEALKQLRRIAGNLGARALRRRVVAYRLARKLEAGDVRSGFSASGEDFGFDDILGCAEFLRTQVLGDRSKRRIDMSAAGTAARAGAVVGAGLP